MNLTHDTSIIALVLHASLPVKLVMGALLLASIVSWYYIFFKAAVFKHATQQADAFEKKFWSGGDLHALSRDTDAKQGAHARIFEAGFNEFSKLHKNAGIEPRAIIDGTRRAMRATAQRELDYLEAHLSFLASVGSVSPYVGLLGTVWGIMNSFRGLSNAAQAALTAVAPGIAEALIATAMGLFAAIPAVVAYNNYADDLNKLETRFDTFIEEFSNILQRQA